MGGLVQANINNGWFCAKRIIKDGFVHTSVNKGWFYVVFPLSFPKACTYYVIHGTKKYTIFIVTRPRYKSDNFLH